MVMDFWCRDIMAHNPLNGPKVAVTVGIYCSKPKERSPYDAMLQNHETLPCSTT